MTIGGEPPFEIRTHAAMDTGLSGEPVSLAEGRARLAMETTEPMRADAKGLVHGGFVFSMADHAAMLAINHPHVVLGSASSIFLRPVVVGERLLADAAVVRRDGKKIFVRVEVAKASPHDPDERGEAVFEGEFTCFTPPGHVLDR